MKFLVINGPNLNMLGVREVEIYGTQTLSDIENEIKKYTHAKNVEVDFFSSNHEGAIIDKIQDAYQKYDGIIINPAAYTHTSIAIADAISAVSIPTVEVHLSDIETREEYRKHSFIKEKCIAQIKGEGLRGYLIAVDKLLEYIK